MHNLAHDAIDQSTTHNQIVTIDYNAEAYATLERICDDSVCANEVTEFWGSSPECGEWRVHMRREIDGPSVEAES